MLTAKRSMENARPCPPTGVVPATTARTIAATPRSRHLTRASRAADGFAVRVAREGHLAHLAIIEAVEHEVSTCGMGSLLLPAAMIADPARRPIQSAPAGRVCGQAESRSDLPPGPAPRSADTC